MRVTREVVVVVAPKAEEPSTSAAAAAVVATGEDLDLLDTIIATVRCPSLDRVLDEFDATGSV